MGRILALKSGAFAVLAVVVLAGPRAAAATPTVSGKPVVAVATFAGIDRLRQDMDLIGTLGGVSGLRAMFEGAVAAQTGGTGLAGIDRARPWGVIYLGSGLRPLFLVPCSDLSSLTETLANLLSGRSTDLGDGSFEIQTFDSKYFVRQSGHYAFFAKTVEDLDDLPTNPDEFFHGLHQSYDAAARIHWQAVPAELRERVVKLVRTSVGRDLPGRGEWVEEFTAWLERTDTITLGSRLDEATQKASLDLTWRAVEGPLAEQVAHYVRTEPMRLGKFTS